MNEKTKHERKWYIENFKFLFDVPYANRVTVPDLEKVSELYDSFKKFVKREGCTREKAVFFRNVIATRANTEMSILEKEIGKAGFVFSDVTSKGIRQPPERYLSEKPAGLINVYNNLIKIIDLDIENLFAN